MANEKINEIRKLVGKTPLVNIEGILAKLETTNPTGSVKDRMAWYIIEEAEKRGELKPGMKIIEMTSGNTGIGLSMVSAIKGYNFTAVMPESMSEERKKMMRAFGAELVLTPAKEDMAGALKKYNELAEKNPEAYFPKQFENPDNYICHEFGLGKELADVAGGKIDAFVAGMGTGGTLIGVARALKNVNPNVKIFGIEPEESPIITKGYSGLHKIQGIGEGFIPKMIRENMNLIDEVIRIKSDDAVDMSKKLARDYGLLVGISSGANIVAARELQKRYKNVATVLPDRGERYLSSSK